MRRTNRTAALRLALGLLALAPLAACTGCGSILGRGFDIHGYGPPLYTGVAADVVVIQEACSPYTTKSRAWGLAAVIDAPLSAAVDTALLPIDLIVAASER